MLLNVKHFSWKRWRNVLICVCNISQIISNNNPCKVLSNNSKYGWLFLYWGLVFARLNSHYKAWSYNNKYRKINHAGNLFRKNLLERLKLITFWGWVKGSSVAASEGKCNDEKQIFLQNILNFVLQTSAKILWFI